MQKAWDNPNTTQIVMAWIALSTVLFLTYILWQANKPEVVEAQATPTLQIGPVILLERDVVSVPLILSDSPEGIAGFDVTVSLSSDSVASIIGAISGPVIVMEIDPDDPLGPLIPVERSLGLQDIDLGPTLVHIRAVDLARLLSQPPADITLATIDLIALAPGTTNISVAVRRLDSITGESITPDLFSNTVDVTKPFPTIIGQLARAQDIDRDGLAEDLNANGRHDFADIVIFFNNIDAAEVKDNIPFFDFDQDRNISFNDILAMFQLLIR